MKIGHKSTKKSVNLSFYFVVLLLFGAIVGLYAQALSEPGKFLLLGAALVGIAIWTRRYRKRQENP
jgi:hypothetical protein